MGRAYPTRIETATGVAKLLLKEMIPRFGLPYSIQSDKNHCSLQKSPRRGDRHYRFNGNYMHFGDLNVQGRLRKLTTQ